MPVGGEETGAQCVVDEAFFAEVNGAHDVLSATIAADVARRLAPWLDLPGQLPPGLTIDSYISGFPFEAYYVVARTSLDGRASRRGMVFTHAALVSLEQVPHLGTIRPLVEHLHSERPQRAAAQQFDVPLHGSATARPPQLAAVAQHLVSARQRPAVVADPTILEAVVVGLWPFLPGALRQRFVFGLSFAPEDIGERRPDLVATLTTLTSRWPDDMVVSSHSWPTSAVGAFLAGQGSPDFLEFLRKLEREYPSFDELSKVDRLWSRLTDGPSTFSSLLSAARLIAAMQPNVEKGRAIKTEVITRMCRERLTIANVRQLRNFETSGFADGERLWRAATDAMREALCGAASSTDAVDLLDAAASSQQSVLWQGAFSASLQDLPAERYRGLARSVWQILGQRLDLAVGLSPRCPPAAQFDRVLAETLPEAEQYPSWEGASAILLEGGWCVAEAALLATHHERDLERALKILCARASAPEAAIDHVLRRMSAAEIVGAAIRLGHGKLNQCAVGCIAATPEVLAAVDLSMTGTQKLWADAIGLSGEAWKIGGDAEGRWFALLSTLVDDSSAVVQQLVDRLATTPLANLLGHPRRRELWQALPASCAGSYCLATARAWIGTISAPGPLPADPIEDVLCRTIAGAACRDELMTALRRVPFERLLSVFSLVPCLSVETCESALRGALAAQVVSVADAEAAGRLLANRSWTRVVRSLYQSYGRRADLRPLFVICADALSYYDRFVSGLSRPANHELHEMLAEVAVALYPRGPGSEGLWERAGGRMSDLVQDARGRDQWSDALRRLRSGALPRPRLLIRVMLDDFPHNETLRYLDGQDLY